MRLSTRVVLGLGAMLAIAIAIALYGSPMRYQFSEQHKSNIAGLATRICSAGGVQPCPVTWSGKHKWFGNLLPQGPVGVASYSQLKVALPAPEWSETSSSEHREFTNGSYTVSYHVKSGTISITSAE